MVDYFFQKNESTIKEFLKKLAPIGLNHFAYARVFKDQSDAFLTSDAALGMAFIEEKFYERIYCGSYDDYVNSFALSISMGQDEVFQFYSDNFNTFYTITLVKKFTNYVEFIHYSAPLENTFINNFYLNNVDYLIRIGNEFKESHAKLIKESESHRITYPTEPGDLSCLTNENFKSLIQTNSDIVTTTINKLTPREFTCLTWLAEALSAKEIAIKMNCSYRTVEKHIEKLKIKLGCRSCLQLIKYYYQHIDRHYSQ